MLQYIKLMLTSIYKRLYERNFKIFLKKTLGLFCKSSININQNIWGIIQLIVGKKIEILRFVFQISAMVWKLCQSLDYFFIRSQIHNVINWSMNVCVDVEYCYYITSTNSGVACLMLSELIIRDDRCSLLEPIWINIFGWM